MLPVVATKRSASKRRLKSMSPWIFDQAPLSVLACLFFLKISLLREQGCLALKGSSNSNFITSDHALAGHSEIEDLARPSRTLSQETKSHASSSDLEDSLNDRGDRAVEPPQVSNPGALDSSGKAHSDRNDPFYSSFLKKYSQWCAKIKALSKALTQRFINWVRSFGPKTSNEVSVTRESEVSGNGQKIHPNTHLIRQPVFPIEDSPFSLDIPPSDDSEKYLRIEGLLSRLSVMAQKESLIQKHLEFVRVTKIKSRHLDLGRPDSFLNVLLSGITNIEHTIPYREAEYLIFDHLIRCTDDQSSRQKLYKFYMNDENFRNAVFYGSTKVYLESLRDRPYMVRQLVKHTKLLHASTRWGQDPAPQDLLNGAHSLAYSILKESSLCIHEKAPVFEILKRLTGFGVNSDDVFREAINQDEELLSIFALVSQLRGVKTFEEFPQTSWERRVLRDDQVAFRFTDMIHAEMLGTSEMKNTRHSTLRSIKMMSHRVDLINLFNRLVPTSSESHETLSWIAARFLQLGDNQNIADIEDLKGLTEDCITVFKNSKLDLEAEAWLYSAFQLLKTFGDSDIIQMVLKALSNENQKLVEIQNFNFMNSIVENNGSCPPFQRVSNKAMSLKKLRSNTKLTDQIMGAKTLGQEIQEMLDWLKDEWVPFGSIKMQLYEMLQHLYQSFDNVRDAKFWGRRGKDEKTAKVLVSLSLLIHPENGMPKARDNLKLQHGISQHSNTTIRKILLNLVYPKGLEDPQMFSGPATGFGRGIYPDFSLDRSYMQRLKAKGHYIRSPIEYNGPSEKTRRSVLVKALKNFREDGATPKWMQNLAEHLKQLRLIMNWDTRCIIPINTPAITESVLIYFKDSRHSRGEREMLFRVLEHLMKNNLEVQRKVYQAMKENQELGYALDQTYHQCVFKDLRGDSVHFSIAQINERLMELPPATIWILKGFTDPQYHLMEMALDDLLSETSPENFVQLGNRDKRLVCLLVHYISVRNPYLLSELNQVLRTLPDSALFQRSLFSDAACVKPLVDALARNLASKTFNPLYNNSHMGLEGGFSNSDPETGQAQVHTSSKIMEAFQLAKEELSACASSSQTMKAFDEHTVRIKSISCRLAHLDVTAPWNPMDDFDDENSFYTILNDSLMGMRAQDRSLRACVAYHHILEFLEQAWPDSEAERKVKHLLKTDGQLSQALRLCSQWKPLCAIWKRISEFPMLREILTDILIINRADVFAHPQSPKSKKLLTDLMLCVVRPPTTSEGSSLSSDAFQILNVLAIGSATIRKVLIQTVKAHSKLYDAFFQFLSPVNFEDSFPRGSIGAEFLRDPTLHERTYRSLVCQKLGQMKNEEVSVLCKSLQYLKPDWPINDLPTAEVIAQLVISHLYRTASSREPKICDICVASYITLAYFLHCSPKLSILLRRTFIDQKAPNTEVSRLLRGKFCLLIRNIDERDFSNETLTFLKVFPQFILSEISQP